MSEQSDLAALVVELLGRIEALERAGRLQHSTVEVDGQPIALPVGLGAGVAAGAAIPGLEEGLATARVEVEAAGQAADAAVIAAAKASADVASAQEDIDAALADVDGRVSQASADASAASQRADAAKSSADAATSAAGTAEQAARDAAGVAAEKGLTIYQVSAPTGARAVPQNLWIDITNGANTPNRYDTSTSKWVPITDKAATDAAAAAAVAKSAADTAKAAAATAQSKADQAAAAASTAQTTANGKNTITYRASPPTTSDVGATVGDVWFIRSTATGILTGQYEWTGPTNGWQQRMVGDLLIANLDAGKLTAGYIAAARIAADTIVATMLAADAVLARNIKAGEIVAGKLAVDSVVAANIVAATITGDKLLANTITAREIKAGTITADLLSADAINGKTITGVTIIGATLQASGSSDSAAINIDKYGISISPTQGGQVNGRLSALSTAVGSIFDIEGPPPVVPEAKQARLRMHGGPNSSFTQQVDMTFFGRVGFGDWIRTTDLRSVATGTENLLNSIQSQMFVANQAALPASTTANGTRTAKKVPADSSRIIRKLRYIELNLNGSGLPNNGTRLSFDSAFPNECLGVFMTTVFGSGIAPVINGSNIDRAGFQPIWAGQGATTVGLLYEAIGW